MTIGEIKAMNLSDDTEIKINTVWNEEKQEFLSTGCDGFYHKEDNKVYLTPYIIIRIKGG